MTDEQGLTEAELMAEGVTALPDKEVFSVLDLNADINVALDAAAPIDLGVAANLNVAAPLDAAATANLLSSGASAQALSDQQTMINQGLHADAISNAMQDATIDQADVPAGTTASEAARSLAEPVAAATGPAPLDGATGTVDGVTGGVGDTVGGVVDGTTPAVNDTLGKLSDGNLLNVNVKVDVQPDLAAPIAGGVAANANVAAPIEGSVAANLASPDSQAVAVSHQTAIINQELSGTAETTADQQADIVQ